MWMSFLFSILAIPSASPTIVTLNCSDLIVYFFIGNVLISFSFLHLNEELKQSEVWNCFLSISCSSVVSLPYYVVFTLELWRTLHTIL